MATVVIRKKGAAEETGYLRVVPDRHPWRELGAILTLSQADKQGGTLALTHLRHLPGAHVGIWTGGLAADKNKLLDMAEWFLRLPRELLDTTCLKSYQVGVAQANFGEKALWSAVSCYGKVLKNDTPSTDLARTLYWSALDRDCQVLADTAADPTASLDATWLPRIRAAMQVAYEQVCPHASPRQIQAYAIGLRHLHLRPADRRADSLRTRSSVADAEQVR